MDNIIQIKSLNKKLSKNFAFEDFSLDIKKGYVTGLIGPNGSGKTSLIKLIMGLYVKDSGNIDIFSKDFEKYEESIKQDIGYVSDSPSYIANINLFKIKEMVSMFYENWSDELYKKYMKEFELDESVSFEKLSKGMKIKFSLALALSHQPKLLILDEPTAGIDPIFRRQMLDILYDFIDDGEKSVLFSTHITSDLDKIADYIVFIKDASTVLSGEKDQILSSYFVVKAEKDYLTDDLKKHMISTIMHRDSFEGLVKNDGYIGNNTNNLDLKIPTIEDLMYFLSKN